MCEVGGEGNLMEVRVTNPKVVGKTIKDINFRKKPYDLLQMEGKPIIAHSS